VKARTRLRRLLKWTGFTTLGLVALALIAALIAFVWLNGRVRGSLPLLDGERDLPGLSAHVTVERDNKGVPTIRGSSRTDVARGTGFLHAQDRFFQMDLSRRSAAGELAELFGAAALPLDRNARVHRFRALARRNVEQFEPGDRALFEAYAAGVNAGLAALRHPPFEYLFLWTEPRNWEVEDTLLVVFSMYRVLQDDTGKYESTLGLLHDQLPSQLVEFLVPRGTEWDAPLQGEPFETPPIPAPEVFDLRRESRTVARLPRESAGPESLAIRSGSNNWAVAGSHTADGNALLANDMHLPLGVPNIWYRASFVWTEEEEHRVTGVTLPGAPMMVAGSNGHVAWGFTNAELDLSDLVLLETEGDSYRTPEGLRAFERYEERIRVDGAEDEVLEVLWTIWGPVIDHDHRGRQRALRWVAHEPDAVNSRLTWMERARDLDEALEIATQVRIPTENCVVADREGRIGWTLMGPLPRRRGAGGRRPESWSDGRGWDGLLSPEEHPRIVDPPGGRIWTANNRVLGHEWLARLGDGQFSLGARARQIRDRLAEEDSATPESLLALQLDDRALFLERWRDLLLELLDETAVHDNEARAVLRRVVREGWTGHASLDSAGYRLVRAFRLYLADLVFDPITATCREADDSFRFRRTLQWEGPLWRLVNEKPPHLLDPERSDWNEVLLAAVDQVIERFVDDDPAILERRTWGERNTVRLRHPISRALPPVLDFVTDRLDMPAARLPGDAYMPRVQGLTHGASERFVVSPGHEEQGIFHMPGGQSAHPNSPYYRAGHSEWERGEPATFLPGPALHRLVLNPVE